MTYIECRNARGAVWIGPFATARDARSWLRRYEKSYQLRHAFIHERRVKTLFAAHEKGEVTGCVGVFDTKEEALAAAGPQGIVINWTSGDFIGPEEVIPALRILLEPPVDAAVDALDVGREERRT